MDVDGSGEIVPTLDRGIVRVIPDTPEHYLQLLQDAPLLLEFYKEVKRIMDIDEILETSRVELIWIKLLEMSE